MIGRIYTQRIDRENFTLHTRRKCLNQKTIGHSKVTEMHNKLQICISACLSNLVILMLGFFG
ncbi:IS1 family transposase [Candidatus Enterovibrio escicola]|uniref:IS1 family transposase n=1 Tax=Candidatus Enterovibrio escicola TaxID=1927127 RepID=UPI000BE3E531